MNPDCQAACRPSIKTQAHFLHSSTNTRVPSGCPVLCAALDLDKEEKGEPGLSLRDSGSQPVGRNSFGQDSEWVEPGLRLAGAAHLDLVVTAEM